MLREWARRVKGKFPYGGVRRRPIIDPEPKFPIILLDPQIRRE